MHFKGLHAHAHFKMPWSDKFPLLLKLCLLVLPNFKLYRAVKIRISGTNTKLVKATYIYLQTKYLKTTIDGSEMLFEIFVFNPGLKRYTSRLSSMYPSL